jgi:hypothetical protein
VNASGDDAASSAAPAAVAETAAPARAQAKPQVERRSANRPWSGNRAKAAAEPMPAKARAAQGEDDSVWKEF